jgi:predicted O-methyltransferase YrrM
MGSAKYERDGLFLTRGLLDYVRAVSVQETEAQSALRLETAQLAGAAMMTPPEQGQLMHFLARLIGARRIVEVGSYTGYGTTWLAAALPADAEADARAGVVACEREAAHMEVARQAWRRCGLTDRIDGRLGPAEETLRALATEGWGGATDMIFVDADKTGYATYYALGLALLRPGGLMLFDNVLWGGDVARPEVDDASTGALRAIVRMAAGDDRVEHAVLTDGDGLLAVRKRFASETAGADRPPRGREAQP